MDPADSSQPGETLPARAAPRPSSQDWRIIALLMLLALSTAVLLVALGFWFR
jgi:hypothetical protein